MESKQGQAAGRVGGRQRQPCGEQEQTARKQASASCQALTLKERGGAGAEGISHVAPHELVMGFQSPPLPLTATERTAA